MRRFRNNTVGRGVHVSSAARALRQKDESTALQESWDKLRDSQNTGNRAQILNLSVPEQTFESQNLNAQCGVLNGKRMSIDARWQGNHIAAEEAVEIIAESYLNLDRLSNKTVVHILMALGASKVRLGFLDTRNTRAIVAATRDLRAAETRLKRSSISRCQNLSGPRRGIRRASLLEPAVSTRCEKCGVFSKSAR